VTRLGAPRWWVRRAALPKHSLLSCRDNPLWQWLTPGRMIPRLPVPHFNVVNGSVHAKDALDFQEFMIAPIGEPSLPGAVRAGAELCQRLCAVLAERGFETGLGDEDGFAAEIALPNEVLG
jgi:enolase